MSFLTPWSALIGGAVAVPLLLLLYFLKLRRWPVRMPSTLLWRQSFEDLQVNTPFQRLRASLLLFLQLLLLALVLLALAQPVIDADSSPSARAILLIDHSASMQAINTSGLSRLEQAKSDARDIVRRRAELDRETETMIIGFARSPRVVASFTSDLRALIDAIESIEATDEASELSAALKLAGAFSAAADEQTDALPGIVLLSDGCDASRTTGEQLRVSASEFRYVASAPPIRANAGNIGIVEFAAQRDHEDPATVLTYARLINASDDEVATTLTLRINDDAADIRQIVIPPAEPDAPGEFSVSFRVESTRDALLMLTHSHSDALVVDNATAAWLPAPRRLRVMHVYGDRGPNEFLRNALQVFDPIIHRVLPLDAFRADQLSDRASRQPVDLVVFDHVSGHSLPDAPSLTFGGAPAGMLTVEDSDKQPNGDRILSWQRRHAMMRYVSLDDLRFKTSLAFEPADHVTPLASARGGAVIAMIESRELKHVLVGFPFDQSNWWKQVSFTVFMQNIVNELTLAGAGEEALTVRSGDLVQIRPVAGTKQLRLTGPTTVVIATSDDTVQSISAPSKSGVYAIEGVIDRDVYLPVNLLSQAESDIRPLAELRVNAVDVAAGEIERITPRQLWPWLVAVALVVLTIEWLVYCSRFRAV